MTSTSILMCTASPSEYSTYSSHLDMRESYDREIVTADTMTFTVMLQSATCLKVSRRSHFKFTS